MRAVLSKCLICLMNRMRRTPLPCPLLNAHLLSLCFQADLVVTITSAQEEGGRCAGSPDIGTGPNEQIFKARQTRSFTDICPCHFPCCKPRGAPINQVFVPGFMGLQMQIAGVMLPCVHAQGPDMSSGCFYIQTFPNS